MVHLSRFCSSIKMLFFYRTKKQTSAKTPTFINIESIFVFIFSFCIEMQAAHTLTVQYIIQMNRQPHHLFIRPYKRSQHMEQCK